MLKSILRDTRGVNKAQLGDVKIQEDVKMYSRLGGYDDFRGSYLASETDLPATPRRIYAEFSQPPWLTLKRHLFSTHMAPEIFKKLRDIPVRDKQGEFNHERLRRRGCEIHISKTSNGISGMDFFGRWG